MWIALSDAIREYGIKEINTAIEGKRTSPPISTNALSIPPTSISKSIERENDTDGAPEVASSDVNGTSGSNTPGGVPVEVAHMVELEKQIASEAFKSSTRIAGLVSSAFAT